MADAELTRLSRQLPVAELADERALADAGRVLDIDWPPEYIALISRHNGVEGFIADWLLVLIRVEDLIERNADPIMDYFPGLVVIGGNGSDEALAIDRASNEILLVPWLGGEEDWLLLGANLTEAFQRMERDEVFDAPRARPDPASCG